MGDRYTVRCALALSISQTVSHAAVVVSNLRDYPFLTRTHLASFLRLHGPPGAAKDIKMNGHQDDSRGNTGQSVDLRRSVSTTFFSQSGRSCQSSYSSLPRDVEPYKRRHTQKREQKLASDQLTPIFCRGGLRPILTLLEAPFHGLDLISDKLTNSLPRTTKEGD